MTSVKVRAFGGMVPSKSTDLLQAGEAANAVNTKLTSGALEAYRGLGSTLVTFSGGTVKSIYRYGQTNPDESQFWFQNAGDTNVVRGPIDGDTEERTYLTGGVAGDGVTLLYPRKTKSDIATASTPYPTTTLHMGIPAPSGAVTATVSGTATNPSDPAEAVTYVVTYVSTWGEEGPECVASATVSWQPGQTITLTALQTGPGAGYSIASKNIYRSASGSASTKFQLVTNVALATTSYADTTPTSALVAVLATRGWVEPPSTMIGLTVMANGVLAGFTGNTLCFSEPYAPYAWPVRYQKSTDAPIVGLGAFGQSLFVGTTTGIYTVTGTDPATFSMEKLGVAQSCVSKRSIVEMNEGVVFASPDGLMYYGAAGLKNLTDGLMTRVEWQAYTPSSISGYESDNRYIAFFDNGTRQGGMIFTFGSTPTFCETDVYCTAGYRDKSRDALYLVTSNTLRKWDSGSALTYTWTSGTFHLPLDTNMSCARVDSAAYPLTFQLYADGALKHTQTVANRYAFRLPSGYRSARYSFTLSGTGTVRSVELADKMSELSSA